MIDEALDELVTAQWLLMAAAVGAMTRAESGEWPSGPRLRELRDVMADLGGDAALEVEVAPTRFAYLRSFAVHLVSDACDADRLTLIVPYAQGRRHVGIEVSPHGHVRHFGGGSYRLGE